MDQEKTNQETEEPATVENSSSSACSALVESWTKEAARLDEEESKLYNSGHLDMASRVDVKRRALKECAFQLKTTLGQ